MPTVIAVAVVDATCWCRCSWPAASLDRLARDRDVGAGAFFSACGVFFVRFIRLGLIAVAVYWMLFGPYHAWLFDDLYPALIADVTVERTAFFIRARSLRRVRGAAVLLQHPVRLREDPRGGRGSPQHDRRDRRELAVHPPPSDRGVGALQDQRAAVPDRDRHLLPDRARRELRTCSPSRSASSTSCCG